jgi:hypothetical protein
MDEKRLSNGLGFNRGSEVNVGLREGFHNLTFKIN